MSIPFQHKMKFTERFRNRHPLRFHMSLILLATVCSGFLATRIMLALKMENVLWRYPLTVVFAYIVFFVSVKLWLKYISPTPPQQKFRDNFPDLAEVLPDIPIPFPSGGTTQFHGGGGGFDGGGASDNFGEVGTVFSSHGSELFSGGGDTGEGVGDAMGDVVGGVAEGLGDEGGIVVIVVFAALAAVMAVVIGTGAYLVYEAPFILSEAAFEFILAAGLLRGTKRIDRADWVGSVFKTTCVPFIITLAMATIGGYLMRQYFPDVTRISELLSRL